ncbi:MAG: NAD(P)-dependent alcohol dehydrogenase [Bacteroidetes bacterium]|nr:MAG: NAD(P)-dependent alcohol dehydrogenase [Bacteroidota bacterium]
MKAIMCTRYGAAEEVLVLQDVEQPTPKADEILIHIHATSVTASDVLIRNMDLPFMMKMVIQLAFGFGKPRNPIFGMVCAGTVEEIGEDVNKFKLGDEVFAYGSMSPTKRRFGSYAEYICLPQDWNLALKPKNMSFEQAAAIPYGGLLALHMFSKVTIQKGDRILIYGASGSIGTMAIQLPKHEGALVTSVCSAKNFDLVSSLGSDKMIDYQEDDAAFQLESYDFVFDAVGKQKTSLLKEHSKKALTTKGRYISIDDGTPRTPKEAFLRLKTLAESGMLPPVIDRVYPLSQMAEAHHYVEQGHKTGSVVISV